MIKTSDQSWNFSSVPRNLQTIIMWLQWCVITNFVLSAFSVPLQGEDATIYNADNSESGVGHREQSEVLDLLMEIALENSSSKDITPIEESIDLDELEVIYLEPPKDNSSPRSAEDEPPEEKNTPGMFESDIRLTDEQSQVLDVLLTEDNSTDADGVVQKRKGIANLYNRWPQAVVPYDIDPSITDSSGIMKAIEHWEYYTCIKFKPKTKELTDQLGHSDHALFEKGEGFWSYVGRVGLGPQTVSIGDESRVGSIAHEIGHVIGFWHEQARPDRDKYVTIMFENVVPGYEDAFKMYNWEQVITHSLPYDVGSLMHYGAYYFSKNHKSMTIVAKNPADQEKLGNREALSKHDIQLANIMYNCPEPAHCTDHKNHCKNWALKGYCEGTYEGYMLKKCPKSCGVCYEKCTDKNEKCANWKKQGFCEGKYQGYMTTFCKKSCGVCSTFGTR